VTSTINVGNGPSGISVNAVTNLIYVANRRDNSISVIDGATNSVKATINVGGNFTGLSVNSINNRINLLNLDTKSVMIIDGSSNEVIATIPAGTNPGAIAQNQGTDFIYVADQDSNNISFIDGSTNMITDMVGVGMSPESIGVNTVANNIYAGNFGNSSISVLTAPDFTLSFNPAPVTIARGTSDFVMLAITNSGGFSGKVTVQTPSIKGIKIKSASSRNAVGTQLFSIKVKKTAAAGTQLLTFTGQDSSGRMRAGQLTLIIQ
jgi:YVTN family beta-propeller protein